MHAEYPKFLKIAGGVGVWLVALLSFGIANAQRNDPRADEGAQVLTRGPVHEAFANLSESENAPGEVYSKSPPDDIEELPPDQQPDGENVSWIPGYWSFDDDRGDYIWVSGVWRDVPPNRQWVPGYWNSVRGGSQFVSGFWSDIGRTEVEYLPQPPAPLDVGPSSPTVGRDANWAPGSWVWVDQRYAWQPGYWVVPQPNWVWTPAHYVWTPRGYVYVSAYWDYDISRRGVMFAPVYYSSPVYRQPNYYYSPSIVINLSFAFGSLFVHSHSHHYYYGDYYDDRYRRHGYEPWYSRYDRHDRDDRYYREDPIFVSYRSQQLRRDKNWDRRNREQYTYRREHVEARPAQTYARSIESGSDRRGADRQAVAIATPLDQVVKSETQTQRFRTVDSGRRKEYQSQARDVKQYRAERQKIEAEPDTAVSTTQTADRVRQPVSPNTSQPQTRDTAKGQSQRDQGKSQPSAKGDSTQGSVRAEQPTSPSVVQPQTRDGGRTQTQRGQDKKQPSSAPDPNSGTVRAERPAPAKGAEGPARDATQSPPAQKQVTAEPGAAPDSGNNAERAHPVKKNIRQSPIAGRQAKTAPAAPDIPKPQAQAPEPASRKPEPAAPAPTKSSPEAKSQDPSAKTSPPNDGGQQQSKGRSSKHAPSDSSTKKDARHPN